MIALLALLAAITSPYAPVSYGCNGVTAAFSVTFPYQSITDLVVTSTTGGGSVTTLVLTTDYTLNLTSTQSTATLTLANPAVKCPNGNTLKITRVVALTQPTSFRSQTNFNPALHEMVYDRLEMQIGQLSVMSQVGPLTGDVTTSSVTSGVTTLSNTAILAGPYGSASQIPQITFDAKGRAIAASNQTPSLPTSAITSGTFSDLFLSSAYSGVAVCAAHRWTSTLARNTAPTCTQPDFSDLSGSATDVQLVNAYSGVGVCAANTWASTLTRNTVPTCTQPGFSNLSGTASTGQIPNLDASKITTGTFALTGSLFANQGTTTTVLHGNGAGNESFGGVSLTADATANQGTTTTVLHGNAAGQPSFGAVALGAEVSGTLPEARGGTNAAAITCAAGTMVTSDGTTYSCGATSISTQHSESSSLGAASSCSNAVSVVTTITVPATGTYLITGTVNVFLATTPDTVTIDIIKNASTAITGAAVSSSSPGLFQSTSGSVTVVASLTASDVVKLRCTETSNPGQTNGYSLVVTRLQ